MLQLEKEMLTGVKVRQGLHGEHGDCDAKHKGHLPRGMGEVHRRMGAAQAGRAGGKADEEEFDSDELHKHMHMIHAHDGSSELGDEDEVSIFLKMVFST